MPRASAFTCLPALSCALAATVALSGCETLTSVGSAVNDGIDTVFSWSPRFLGPYRPDVHQGNIITQEMVDQLRIGMTREQVRFMLGTPLLSSEFHKNRVDYVYYLNPRRGPVQNRRLTLWFKDNRLDKFNADPMPRDEEADMLILGANLRRKPHVPTSQEPEIPMPDISTPPPGSD